MFSSNGSINLRKILIINLFFFIILSVFLVIKNRNFATLSVDLNCEIIMKNFVEKNSTASSMYNLEHPIRGFEINKCDRKFNKDRINKIKVFYIEPDNHTYIMRFIIINKIKFEKKKIENLIVESELYKNIFEYQKEVIFLSTLNYNYNIKSSIVLEPISKLYVKIFSNNEYVYHFLYLIFISYFILNFLLFYLILNKIFSIKDKIISLLITSNVFAFPLFLIYYLAFYKEPVLLLGFLSIIFNFLYFYKENKPFHHFLASTILLIFVFELINIYKSIYLFIYIFSFLISLCFLFISTKKTKYKLYLILKFFILIIFVLNIQIIKDFNFLKKIQFKNSDIILSEDERFLTDPEKFKKLVKKEFRYIKNKNNVIKQQLHLIKNPEQEKVDVYKWENLNCSFIHKLYCQRFNNLMFRINSVKISTLNENVRNKNSLNMKDYKGSWDILKALPFSIKSYFMPIKINKNVYVISLTIFKIFISILFILSIVILYKNKDKSIFKKILIGTIIFLPLMSVIDLVTSNFFTYSRYVYPFNVYIFLIIYGTLTNHILNEKNKYFNKFW